MNRNQIIEKLKVISPDSEGAVELSSMLVFDELGWEIIYAENEIDGDEALLGRPHQGDVVLERYFYPALKELNPDLPEEVLIQAKEQIVRDRSTMSLAEANLDVYSLLKNGIKVSFRDSQGNEQIERVKVIDWNEPEKNHFLLVSQLWVNGPMYRRRADLVGFVNGVPLMLMELKEPSVNLHHAYHDNLRDYKDTIPQLLWCNGIVLLSNSREAKAGSITASWEHFAEWKKINDEGEMGIVDLDTLIRGICQRDRFLDILENFTVFQEAPGGLIKIVAKNHQYLGVNNAIKAIQKAQEIKGRLGVFWHTQGAGKTESMIFFCQKVLRKIPGNWTFVIVTDRTELDDQIYGRFQDSGVVTEDHVQATSSNHLRQLLSEDHRYIFTLIHKFRTEQGQKHPQLSERDDIIVITDEAHRSQYDILAQNMRDALPKAAFIGFTGTPLIRGEEEKTREVFGDYISVYNFKQSIDDKATVPLFYENRIPEVQLNAYGEDCLNDEMNRIIDEAMLDTEQEKKLERDFGRMYHIITRDDRLEKVAADIVDHFMGRGHMGKAIVVAVDKATAVKLYDKIRTHWQKRINDIKRKIPNTSGNKLEALENTISFMEETDMAVVVSPGQNEIDDLRRKGVDIRPHRERMNREELDVKFKDPQDPFRIVFVCAMWMTGFDVPSCSTIYVDKPMRNHTLMQTIARANRVFEDKPNGLIVDYAGVFSSLEKALAIYAAPGAEIGELPVKDKKELFVLLQQAITETVEFVRPLGIDLEAIRDTVDVFHRTKLKEDAVDAVIESKKEFLRLADKVNTIYKAYLPDPIEPEVGQMAYLIHKIAKQIRSIGPEVDVSEVMQKVDQLLDRSVDGFVIQEPDDKDRLFNLSQIDFDKLKARFNKGHKKTQLERLKTVIEKKLNELVAINRTRMDYLQRYKDMIKEYLAGAYSIENIFQKLVDFSRELEEEEQRYIREELDNEEELAIFDLLTKPDMNLTKKEIKKVKVIARQLLETLKTKKFVLDWKKKMQTRASVKLAINEVLDQLPEKYSPELYKQKCALIYQYVYDLEATAA